MLTNPAEVTENANVENLSLGLTICAERAVAQRWPQAEATRHPIAVANRSRFTSASCALRGLPPSVGGT